MIRISCRKAIVSETIGILRAGGLLGEERVALWLASASNRVPAPIVEVLEPLQIAEVDRFYLPPHSMKALMGHLAATRRRIVAQIHTHPGRAFHSEADAEWAIVRHVGALSLVLPRFASETTVESFLEQAKVYQCSSEGEWDLVPSDGPGAAMEIQS